MEDAGVLREPAPGRTLRVVTDIREDMGSEVFVHFSVDAAAARSEEVVEALDEEAVAATAERARRRGVPFIARIDRMTLAREGEPIDLVVDTKHLHFFDPETGLGLYDAAA